MKLICRLACGEFDVDIPQRRDPYRSASVQQPRRRLHSSHSQRWTRLRCTWTAAVIEGDGDRPLAQLVSEST